MDLDKVKILSYKIIDLLHKWFIDYRGLIDSGLAIDINTIKLLDKYIVQSYLDSLCINEMEYDDIENMSDGFHTFKELYEFRLLYNAAFFNELAKEGKVELCKSHRHSSGEICFGGGWFIVMANLPTGQISNHYEDKDWDLFNIPEIDKAWIWDGHTSKEATERLKQYLINQ